MKAIVCTKYGLADVLQLGEVSKPVPAENEVLIKVHASSITAADSMMRRGTPYYARLFLGLMRPGKPIPGTGFAGVVESTGSAVKRFSTGDRVFGETGVNFSAHAEYVCVPQDGVVVSIPENINYDEAATICDGPLTSLNFLKNIGQLKAGQHILINGASGSLGSAAVQLARQLGAEVTGVCSTSNVDMVKSLGADSVIDYTQQDFTKSGQHFDLIYDTIGKSSFTDCKTSLTENGVYVSPVLSMPLLWQMIWTSKVGRQKAKFSATGLLPAAELNILLDELKPMIETGKIRQLIDRRYPLEQATEANRYVDSGHKKGNIVFSF